MDYITIRRARFLSLSGDVNIPYGTKIDCIDGILRIDNKPLCGDHSQNAYEFFARNDDENGLSRGKLTQTIRKTLAKQDKKHQDRWDKVWADSICQKYKRKDHIDYWLWDYNFFNAEITDLYHIAALVGAKI